MKRLIFQILTIVNVAALFLIVYAAIIINKTILMTNAAEQII